MTQHATPETAAPATEDVPSTPGATTRRRVLATSGIVAAAAAVTAACGSSSSSGSSTPAASTPAAGASTPAAASSSPAAASGVAAKADVPVGGGVILQDKKIVITQPTEGTFKAFSAVCTHQGCVVSSVADGKIDCACHGSVFSAADGSVQQGPASAPLAAVNVTVSGDQITLA
jgi:Rieske Fe-S protein